jgi:hypothetical protein
VTVDCARFQPLLSQLIDGDVDDLAALEVREHLLECPDCAALERDLRRIADAAATLAPCDPPADMWQRIEARLPAATAAAPTLAAARERVPRAVSGLRSALAGWRRSWMLPAALGAAAAAAALLVTMRPVLGPQPAREARHVPEGLVLVGSPSEELQLRERERLPDHVLLAEAQKEFRLAEEHYLKASDRLAALVARERTARPFSPALATAYDRNLKAIDDAIGRCREMARGAPDDPWAHEVLFAAYQRKLRFLEDILRSSTREETVQ